MLNLKIAVFSLTYNRLDLTKKCFERLWATNKSVPWDHYVWDNGSEDGTKEWLKEQIKNEKSNIKDVHSHHINIGIVPAARCAVSHILRSDIEYDILIKIDNDCWVNNDETIQFCSSFVSQVSGQRQIPVLVSPNVMGLLAGERTEGMVQSIRGRAFRHIYIGGIFHCGNRRLFEGFNPELKSYARGWDDSMNPYVDRNNGIKGYLLAHTIDHYLTTAGQHEKYPNYFNKRERIEEHTAPKKEDIEGISW